MSFGMIRSAALVAGLLLGAGLGAPHALACEGNECPAAGKPLDLKKFLREQAASTRTPEAMRATRGKTHHEQPRKIARTHQPRHRAVATRPQSEEAPNEATTAFAAQGSPENDANIQVVDANVQVVSADELNDIDRAAGPTPAETTGKASGAAQDARPTEPDVQVVVQNAFNDIDRKAAELAQSMAQVAATSQATTSHSRSTAASWMQWLWSAIGAGFVVAAGVARYLFA